ncbi:MAG: SDR family NAD(P)-dependent oxidoreductase, partial [Alphaproteobacteria bacterium]|nr:SDR family NAD(P)-dependent oxidoreductase [Alphaproteobacteria bacterium]
MSGVFTGKVAFITGGGTGIGAAAAAALASAGAKVAISGRRKARLDEVVAQIEAAGGTALAIASDVSHESEALSAVEAAAAQFRRLDIIVNAAGVNEAGGIEALSLDTWRKVININLMGTIYTCKAAVPLLKAAGGGDIINISSTAGRRAAGLFGSYATSKHGVNGFSESIRQELGNANIRVSIIEPGATES